MHFFSHENMAPKGNRESVISFHHPKKIEKINSNKGYELELISHHSHVEERKVGGDAYLRLGQVGKSRGECCCRIKDEKLKIHFGYAVVG